MFGSEDVSLVGLPRDVVIGDAALNGTAAPRGCFVADENCDGLLDKLVLDRINDLVDFNAIATITQSLVLSGVTSDGSEFCGEDSVVVIDECDDDDNDRRYEKQS